MRLSLQVGTLYLNSMHHYFKMNIPKCWLYFTLTFDKKNFFNLNEESVLYI